METIRTQEVREDASSGTTSLVFPLADAPNERRQELADFLRARRKAILPAEVGVTATKRRKVRGLRREEIAEMAGISTAWYTGMEQARSLNLSREVLDGVSRALRLNQREQEYLFILAGHSFSQPRSEVTDSVIKDLQIVVEKLDPHPAYVLNSRWDILAWNKSAELLFGNFSKIPLRERNFIGLAFSNSRFRKAFVNWEKVSRCFLAHFRADSVTHVNDPQWLSIIETLNAQSPEFHAWWTDHQVSHPMNWEKVLLHPVHGETAYNTLDLELLRPTRMRIVTYIPVGNHQPEFLS